MRPALLLSSVLVVSFVVSAASCGARTCSPQTCDGCCTAEGFCTTGAENSTCGMNGNACVNCVASGQICGDHACIVFNNGGGTATGGGGGATGGGTGGGSTTGGGAGGGGGAFVCNRVPLECSDQTIQRLDLKMVMASGGITNTPNGTGFDSIVDARAGGSTPTESYTYARFTATGLEKVPLDDMTAVDSMDWEIAFRRFIIRLNGGDSGPSCIAAQVQPVGTQYAAVTAVPANYLAENDDFLTRTPDCAYIEDGSGLPSPRTYLSTFYQYGGCVQMTGRVYVVTTNQGRHVKLTVTGYYATVAAQNTCNTSGTSNMSPGGTIRLSWQYLD